LQEKRNQLEENKRRWGWSRGRVHKWEANYGCKGTTLPPSAGGSKQAVKTWFKVKRTKVKTVGSCSIEVRNTVVMSRAVSSPLGCWKRFCSQNSSWIV
jgi:hypothetical protein